MGTVLVVGTLVESALAEVATLGLKTSLKAQGDCVPDDLVKLGGAGLSAWAAEGCNEVLVPGKSASAEASPFQIASSGRKPTL